MNNPLLIQITQDFIDQYLDSSSHIGHELAMSCGITQHNSCGSGRSPDSPSHLAYLARYIQSQSHEIHYTTVGPAVYIGSSRADLVCKLANKGIKLPDCHLYMVNAAI